MSDDDASGAADPLEPGLQGDYSVTVLGPEAVVESEFGRLTVSGATSHAFIAMLASSGEKAVRYRDLVVGAEAKEGGLAKMAQRLKEDAKLPIRNVKGIGYVLKPAPRSSDLARFLIEGGLALHARNRDRAVESLALWSGDLAPATARRAVFARAIQLRQELRALEARRPKRVLIVEDVYGADIDRKLRLRYDGDLEVVVAASYGDFEMIARTEGALESFHLILLDFHLSDGDERSQGLDAASVIHARPRVIAPVLGISYRRPDVPDEQTLVDYGLWDIILKSAPGDVDALDLLATIAASYLVLPDNLARNFYEERIGLLRRRARGRLMIDGGTPKEFEKMGQHANALVKLLDSAQSDVPRWREAMSAFQNLWLRSNH
jgi:hypothetical protein